MITSGPFGLWRLLRILRWIWLLAIAAIVAWHISLVTADNPEVVRPVILAYIAVCFPISLGVTLILALLGWVSATDTLGAWYALLLVAGLFVGAGWFQWFRAIPWLMPARTRLAKTIRTPDRSTD